MIDFGVKDAIDILIVASMLYYIYKMMKESGTIKIFNGVLAFVVVWVVFRLFLDMRLLGAIMDKFISLGLLVLVILTMLAAVTTGSGNAPFYAFVEMIPKLAHSSGINPAYLTIPMLQASNLGRTLSPVSGVVVAVAGMAKISPFEVVKRTSVPVLVGLVIVIVATELMVPGTAAAVTGK